MLNTFSKGLARCSGSNWVFFPDPNWLCAPGANNDVAIENEVLANALTVLPDDKRDIVLLAFFLDMTDQEIADKLDMVRRTVQYKRAQSLKELKKEMEVTEDGAQSE